jgi:hypothetical protein
MSFMQTQKHETDRRRAASVKRETRTEDDSGGDWVRFAYWLLVGLIANTLASKYLWRMVERDLRRRLWGCAVNDIGRAFRAS